MKQLILSGTLAALATGTIIVLDQGARQERPNVAAREFADVARPQIHAPGKVESSAETIAIRPHFPGTVSDVMVSRGTKVTKGVPLFGLDASRYTATRDLAAAVLKQAIAEKQTLVEGARQSEISESQHNVLAAEARFQRAEKALSRAERLISQNAISTQELEYVRATHDANLALLDAAKERQETISASPRKSELLASDANIDAAQAKLDLATIDLERCQIRSPRTGIILSVEIHSGEWITPESTTASVELADTETLRVVADIDELDALRVQLGQECEITADAMPGKIHRGTVSEIEPRMAPKRIYSGRAGEREEAHARRIRIDLAPGSDLPIGLPVEVHLSAER